MSPLSVGALGVLFHLVNGNTSISAVEIASVFPNGERAIRPLLQELRAEGFVTLQKNRLPNGQVKSSSYVTEKGFSYIANYSPNGGFRRAVIAVHNQLNEPNSLLVTNSLLSDIANKNIIRAANRGEEVGYEFFESTSSSDADEREAERLKGLTEKRAEYQQQKLQASAKTAKAKASRTPDAWTANQSVHEFVNRMELTWGVPQWSLAGSRFLMAFTEARRKYETNGAIELAMMDIFYTNYKVKRGLTTGDIMWKQFIAQFSTLAAQAKLRLTTPDKVQRAMEASEDSWKGL